MDGRHGEKQSRSKCKHDQQRQQDGYALYIAIIQTVKLGGKKSAEKARASLSNGSKPRDPQVSASGIENKPACTSNAGSKGGGRETRYVNLTF